MIPLNINGQIRRYSDRNINKIAAILPYWGLFLNEQNQLAPLFPDKAIRIQTENRSLFQSAKEYIKHTGLSLIHKQGQSIDCDIKCQSDEQRQLSIETANTTYHLKPLADQPTSVSRLIHKQVLLPIKSRPFTILINNNNIQQSAEWIAYILLQLANSQSFPSISHISMSDYQTFVNDILYPVNPKLAKRQMLEAFLPSLPLKPGSIIQPDNEPLSKDDADAEEPADDSGGSMKNLANKAKKEIESHTIQPFKPKLNQENLMHEPEPINPFKKKHDQKPKQINPFKNKHP
ncbi:hypothetical protein JOD45_000241 [Scopulibacillus daqui]|uniref:Uncharacterized protein n=1 Tax=Scopulibacillus daqui TaxID=1469162 RepID=A0ABS2PWG5_9BACL|nr:hypothetical protein [Scopulibacillus daqui]MBM7644050.1 hypothetical protein [Scopulibacillus daqui]